MAHTVFICHSSKDKAVADAACAALEAQRIACWIAPRDVLGGTEYMEELDLALQDCQIVLLIFSQQANDSPQVRREIERAVSYAKIILPFRIEDTLPTRALKFALGNSHWMDAMTPPLEQRLVELRDTVSALMKRKSVAGPLWQPQETVAPEASANAELVPERVTVIAERTLAIPKKVRRRVWTVSALTCAITVAICFGMYKHRAHPSLPSDGRDPLFVAEFDNSTGDTVFDDVLRSVVITELNRSPVVEVVSDSRASELLKSMGKTSEARFTPELARQVCERDKGKYLAEGAIKPQGSAYMIGLTVLECASGGAVSQEQAEAKNIDAVLTTVSGLAAAARLRLSGGDAKSGLDPAPLPTASVRAYKAYIAGEKLVHRQPQQASALLQQATNADPDFAMAWLQLGISDGDLGETKRAADDFTRAFALRNSLGEGGRQWIEAMYYLSATGEVYKAMEALRSWESLNPRATPPHNLLASAYANLGLYQRAVDEFRLSLEVGPEYPVAYMNLSQALLAAGQYDQAATTLDEAPNKDAQWMHERLYQLALLRSDAAGQERERSWMTEHTDDPLVVGMQASMDQFAGDLSASRLHTQRAVQMSLESNLKGSARDMLLAQAEVEALLGESAQAQESAAAALKLSQSREQSGVAWVMALAGQGAEAQQIMDRLVHENPLDTFLNAVDAPLVQAASQLGRGQAAQALHSLEPVKPYEFGGYAGLRPNYLRAMAYLQLRRAKEAAAEFQAVLDHQGVSPMAPEWEMARLGLARAYAMQGNTVKAKTAYQGFLALWKSADSDIPVVNQAKAEYARMGGQF